MLVENAGVSPMKGKGNFKPLSEVVSIYKTLKYIWYSQQNYAEDDILSVWSF